MTIMSLGIMGVMMTVVVPKVTSIFEDFEQALPWYTRADDLHQQHAHQLLVGAARHHRRERGLVPALDRHRGRAAKWDHF
jgi:hypothetical protein